MEGSIQIEIVNWDKYNPRKDLKSMPWFRLSSDIAFDPKLFGLSAEGRWVWIFLLSCAAKEQSGNYNLDLDYVSHHSGVSKKEIKTVFEFLNKKQLVRVTNMGANESDRITNESVPNRTEQNEQNRTNRTEQETVSSDRCSPQTLFDFWNENRGSLPQAMELTEPRKRKAKAQLKKYPDLEHWKLALEKLCSSEFCINEWRPGFDDYLSASKRIKAIEGKYDHRNKASPQKNQSNFKLRENLVSEGNKELYDKMMNQ